MEATLPCRFHFVFILEVEIEYYRCDVLRLVFSDKQTFLTSAHDIISGKPWSVMESITRWEWWSPPWWSAHLPLFGWPHCHSCLQCSFCGSSATQNESFRKLQG